MQIRFGQAVEPGNVDAVLAAERPGAVVVATGARAARDGRSGLTTEPIPGWDGPNVMSYEEALAAGAAGIGRRVLIVDELGDRIAPGLAELLATEGKQVEVVTRWVNLYHMWGVYWNELAWVYGKLDELGVKVVPCAWVKNIDGSKVTCFNVFSSREWETTADTVILVTMKYSNMDVYRLFKAKGVKPVYLIGDAKAPRHIGDAIRDGHAAAREI